MTTAIIVVCWKVFTSEYIYRWRYLMKDHMEYSNSLNLIIHRHRYYNNSLKQVPSNTYSNYVWTWCKVTNTTVMLLQNLPPPALSFQTKTWKWLTRFSKNYEICSLRSIVLFQKRYSRGFDCASLPSADASLPSADASFRCNVH